MPSTEKKADDSLDPKIKTLVSEFNPNTMHTDESLPPIHVTKLDSDDPYEQVHNFQISCKIKTNPGGRRGDTLNRDLMVEEVMESNMGGVEGMHYTDF